MGSVQHKLMPKPGQSFADMLTPPHQRLNIDTPVPGGIEERIRQLQKMRGPVNPPEQFEFWPPPPPGQGPRQIAPDPQQVPEQPLRSVLRRDGMG